jgi:hypothetical protein
MKLALRQGLYLAIADGRLIFLDLNTGRYFSLQDPLHGAFHDYLVGGEQLTATSKDQLAALGIVMQSADPPIEIPRIPIATKTLKFERIPGAFGILSAFRRQIIMQIKLRYLPFERILANLASVRARTNKSFAAAQMLVIASEFESSDLLWSYKDRCLVKSLALLDALLRAGLSAELVIGVHARPFTAHCWVQADDYVLNDTADHIATFTPIFAL